MEMPLGCYADRIILRLQVLSKVRLLEVNPLKVGCACHRTDNNSRLGIPAQHENTSPFGGEVAIAFEHKRKAQWRVRGAFITPLKFVNYGSRVRLRSAP